MPTEAADGSCDWPTLGNCGQSGFELIKAAIWPCSDEFRRKVKVVGRAPGDGSEWAQMFQNQFQIPADRIFEGKPGEEP